MLKPLFLIIVYLIDEGGERMDYLYGRALLKQEIPEKYWPELAQADVKTLSGVIERGG